MNVFLTFYLWNDLTILWNDLTFVWNSLTLLWNEMTWNDLTMERSDRKPCKQSLNGFIRLYFTAFNGSIKRQSSTIIYQSQFMWRYTMISFDFLFQLSYSHLACHPKPLCLPGEAQETDIDIETFIRGETCVIATGLITYVWLKRSWMETFPSFFCGTTSVPSIAENRALNKRVQSFRNRALLGTNSG